MTRSRNADDFYVKIKGIKSSYELNYRPLVERIRRKYCQLLERNASSATDDNLEIHSRNFVINEFFGALNWQIKGETNLTLEAQLISKERATRRFLDYLGFERETLLPLIILETKRPNSNLPDLKKMEPTDGSVSFNEIIVRGLKGESLVGEWDKWLADMKDYVVSVYSATGKTPKRAVITNGEWMILFLDPQNSFIGKDPNLHFIVVLDCWNEIQENAASVFEYLEHSKLTEGLKSCMVSQVPFLVTKEDVRGGLKGVILSYRKDERLYSKALPRIRIAPIVILFSNSFNWIWVMNPPKEFEIPLNHADFSAHSLEFSSEAQTLQNEIEKKLIMEIQFYSISEFFNNSELFRSIQGINRIAEDKYLIVSGIEPHLFRISDSLKPCPFHDWNLASSSGYAYGIDFIPESSYEKRSFFSNLSDFHCAHGDVFNAKSCQLSEGNRVKCGSRSGKDCQAFCEIWQFETRLCCKTCNFFEACSKSHLFKLPCGNPP